MEDGEGEEKINRKQTEEKKREGWIKKRTV